MRSRLRFLLVAMSIVGAAHLYVWLRLVQAPAWPTPWAALASAFLLLAWASIPLTLNFGRRLSPPWQGIVAWAGYSWLGSIFLLLVSVVAVDLTRGALYLSHLWLGTGL